MDKQKIKTLIEHITLHLDTGRELVEEFADLTGADDYLNDALDALDCAYSDLEKLAKEVLPKKKKPTGPRYYFAYGANLNKVNMRMRCPTAKPVGAAILYEHRLVFKGVADVLAVKGQHVHGAVWLIKPRDEESLDQFEGYPHLYKKKAVKVKLKTGEEVECMIYYMNGGHDRSQSLAPPSRGYYRGIAIGYKDFGLPIKNLVLAANREGVRS